MQAQRIYKKKDCDSTSFRCNTRLGLILKWDIQFCVFLSIRADFTGIRRNYVEYCTASTW